MAGVDRAEELYRRLHRAAVNPDGTVNSTAFKRGKDFERSISVDRARLTTPQESVDRARKAGFRLGVLIAGDAMDEGFAVKEAPEPDNPAHCLLNGYNDRQTSRRLAEKTRILEGVESREPAGHP